MRASPLGLTLSWTGYVEEVAAIYWGKGWLPVKPRGHGLQVVKVACRRQQASTYPSSTARVENTSASLIHCLATRDSADSYSGVEPSLPCFGPGRLHLHCKLRMGDSGQRKVNERLVRVELTLASPKHRCRFGGHQDRQALAAFLLSLHAARKYSR